MLQILDRLMTASASLAYIAGPELEDAIAACRRFAHEGLSSTVGYWDTGEGADPREVADAYLRALSAVHAEGLDAYLSIKAPPLQMSSAWVERVVARAREHDAGVHFDSLFPEAADRTLELVGESLRQHPRVGCTVPGRWRRSAADARRAAALGVMRVRVVKGQWEDPGDPRRDLRDGFLAVIDELAGQPVRVAVATHDPPLARQALRRLRDAGTPCELELLFGLPVNAARAVARDLAVPVRMYVPYGKAYMPYALSQLRRNPKVLWWYLRDTLAGGRRVA